MSDAQKYELFKDYRRRLKIAAVHRGISFEELAEHCGVTKQAISAKMPTSKRLIEMCRKLNISAEYLLGADCVDKQLDALLTNEIVPKTARQLYLEQINQ